MYSVIRGKDCVKVTIGEYKWGFLIEWAGTMKKRYRRLLISVMAVLIGAAVLAGFVPKAQMNAQASAEGTDNGGRILFISSYSYAWDTVQVQIEGLKKGISGNIVLDYEFMDTKRVSDETSYQLFYEGLAYRLSKVDPYDVIILGDDAAFDFALDHKDDLFAGIPLVFEGVNDIELAMEAASDPMITGVVEKHSFQKNIELALSIYPDATRVVEILDDTVTGQAERKNFYQNAELYPNLEFSEINASELTTKELKSALKKLDENTILIYVVMTEDASGKQYSNRESIEMISQYSPIPAFRMVDGGNGCRHRSGGQSEYLLDRRRSNAAV